MKKTYIVPVSETLELHTEQMLAASAISISSDAPGVDGGAAWSNNKDFAPKSIWGE